MLCRVGGIYLDTGALHRPAAAMNITRSCTGRHNLLPASGCHTLTVAGEDMHSCLHLHWHNLRLAAVTL